MSFLATITFIGAFIIFVASPGPGVFITISTAIGAGFKNAKYVVFGIILGDLFYLILAVYGLGYLAQTLGDFFIVIKIIGGIYLIYLGYKIYCSYKANKNIKSKQEKSYLANFMTGFLNTLANPKTIIFYLGFLPAFMDLEQLTTGDILYLMVVVATVISLVLLLYAKMASMAKKALGTEKATRRLNKLSGSLMMSVGIYLLARQ
ncbi:MAG: LysE family translocator [Gammaproteobacteria bacterium]|nr:MAG: LysE family translocator [Gammaproteobacteria bacterium]